MPMRRGSCSVVLFIYFSARAKLKCCNWAQRKPVNVVRKFKTRTIDPKSRHTKQQARPIRLKNFNKKNKN